MLKLLEKDPRKRYRDGHHLLEELKALQRSLPERVLGQRGRREHRRPASSAASASAEVDTGDGVGQSRRALRAHGGAGVTRRAMRRRSSGTAMATLWETRGQGQRARRRDREPHPQARSARAARSRTARRDRPQGRGAGARREPRAARCRGVRRRGRGGATRARRGPNSSPKTRSLRPTRRSASGQGNRAIYEAAGRLARHGRSQAPVAADPRRTPLRSRSHRT